MSDYKIEEKLNALNFELMEKWTLTNRKIKKEFKFRDFNEALSFMIEVGKYAEEINHHPEWCNVYNRVAIELTTHSANGLTDLDFKLAKKIEEIYQESNK